jgi:thioredoxin reductase (NADPH)
MERRQIVVIGSGPAAFSAALYAARLSYSPLLIEGLPSKDMIPGGQLMYTTDIENYPGVYPPVTGPELMDRMREQAIHFGTEIRSDDVSWVDFSVRPFRLNCSYSDPVEAEAVIVATGARANWLGLENETRLARMGGGVSSCCVCDMPMRRGEKIVIVGGGDSMCTEVLHAVDLASEVVVVHRRDQFRAKGVLAERVLSQPKVRVQWNKEVVDVLGDDVISGVLLRDVIDGSEQVESCGGMFVAIGHTPNVGFLGGQLRLRENGYLWTHDNSTATSVEGVWGAGDCIDDRFRQAGTAVGLGIQSILEASEFLSLRSVNA